MRLSVTASRRENYVAATRGRDRPSSNMSPTTAHRNNEDTERRRNGALQHGSRNRSAPASSPTASSRGTQQPRRESACENCTACLCQKTEMEMNREEIYNMLFHILLLGSNVLLTPSL